MLFTVFRKIDTFIEKFALYTLVVALFGMLLLTICNIVFRWISVTALWVDPLLRHLVFLSAFLGGTLATGARQHIAIDILSKYLEDLKNPLYIVWQRRILYLVSSVALVLLSFTSVEFIEMTFEYEGPVFFGIERGLLVSIIPFGMCLMAYRFFFLLLKSFRDQ